MIESLITAIQDEPNLVSWLKSSLWRRGFDRGSLTRATDYADERHITVTEVAGLAKFSITCEAKVKGTLLAKCVITTEGTLRSCRILKSLPFLDEPVLAALGWRRYAPVMFQGRPVNVEYVISLRFELP